MGAVLEHGVVETSVPMDRAVLAAVHRMVLEEAEVDPVSGCTLHPKTHVRWLGGTWRVNIVLWQHANGALADGLRLFRTCATLGCQAAAHHVARSPREHGLWLGTNGWQDRQSPSAA